MPPQKKSKIERLKEKLYSPKSKLSLGETRAPIYEDDREVSDSWKKEEPHISKPKKSFFDNTMFRKFFILAVAFFLLSAGFGLVMFFNGNNTVSANNIDINVLGNAFVSGGEQLPLKIEISNRNNVPLQFADLILEYKQGSGPDEKLRSDRFTVGVVPSGGQVEEMTNITLFGQQGTTRDIKITLEYRVPGSNSIFVKEKPYVVNISSTPINLAVDGPEVTNTNQEISFNIKTSLNTEEAVKGMLVVVHYPPGFDFKGATPEPAFSDNIWDLGDLSKGAEKVINIRGVIVADSGENRAFNIYAGTKDPENDQAIGTQFNSEDYLIAIKKPFLDIKLVSNGIEAVEAPAQPGQLSENVLTLVNSLDTKMTDVEITAEFSGNAFDPSGVQAGDGFYDSTNQKIIWNKETKSVLATVDPGDRQVLNFKLRPVSFVNSGIKNGEIDIDISVRARDASQGNKFQEISHIIEKKIKFNTSVQVVGNALYNSGPFTNTGPLPPMAGASTTYTVSLKATNTTNKVTNGKLRATLPLYVDWVGTTSPKSESLNYNQATHEIVWDIGTIEPYAGLSAPAKQVYFQVKLNPSNSQSHSAPKLVNDITFSGKDAFTGADIAKNVMPVDTRLNSDTNYNAENDVVR